MLELPGSEITTNRPSFVYLGIPQGSVRPLNDRGAQDGSINNDG